MESISARLERLKTALTLNWGELADRLAISRAMLDFMRSGERSPSPKLMRVIEDLESQAGLRKEYPQTRRIPAMREEPPAPATPDQTAEIKSLQEKLARVSELVKDLQSELDHMRRKGGL